MHKIILCSLGYCLLMAMATISQMIAPPIARAGAAVASVNAHDAPSTIEPSTLSPSPSQ